MACFNLAWINIEWDYNNSPFHKSLWLEMDRVHISIGSVIFFSPLNSWQKRQHGENKVLLQQLSDGMTFSLWVGTVLHSQQVWKIPQIPVLLGTLLTKTWGTYPQWGADSNLSLRGKGKKRVSAGSMETYWNGKLFKRVSNFISSVGKVVTGITSSQTKFVVSLSKVSPWSNWVL